MPQTKGTRRHTKIVHDLATDQRTTNQIKCNRLRPSCEACQVVQCPCIYGTSEQTCRPRNQDLSVDVILLRIDAVPKKRGPKTDVLEALLKRVDGLEAKLKEKKDQPGASPTDASSLIPTSATAAPAGASSPTTAAAAQDPSSSKKPVSGDSIEVKTQPVPPPTIDTTRSIDVVESTIYTPSPSRYANDYSTSKSRRRIHTWLTASI